MFRAIARLVAAKCGMAPGTAPANDLRQCGQKPRPTVQWTVRNRGGGMSRRTRSSAATGMSGAPQSGQTAGAGAACRSSASAAATFARPCASCCAR